jgi:F0F1-type ATP synthase membrane subunit c/vacuolar-type H+-ATPase subunit K
VRKMKVRRRVVPIPMLVLSLIGSGCSTTYTVVREERRLARFEVTSDPRGATIYVDRAARGKTPAYVEIPYLEVEKEVHPAKPKNGWWLLVTGIVGLGAGVGLTYLGVDALNEQAENPDAGTSTMGSLGLSFGPLTGLYGLFGAVGGVYLLATSRKIENLIETEPASFRLGVNLPGGGFKEARIAPVHPGSRSPGFDKLKLVGYSDPGGWSAPSLPATLQLTSTKTGRRLSTTRRRRRTRRQSRRPAGKAVIIAVFDIEDRGAKLAKDTLLRLSDYLAVQIAATGAYQVIPRDKLKERLVRQKRASYRQCYAQSCQIEIGKELAAQKSLSTMVVKLGSKCNVTSVLYDLRKAASEGGASASGRCDEDGIVGSLETVVRKLVPR